MSRLVFFLQSLITILILSTLVDAISTVVNLNYTSYRGTHRPDGVSDWLGIRYAAPPIGQLRFAAPQDPPSTVATQDADQVSYPSLVTESQIVD